MDRVWRPIHNAGKHAGEEASIAVRVDHDCPLEVSGATVPGIVPAIPIGAGA